MDWRGVWLVLVGAVFLVAKGEPDGGRKRGQPGQEGCERRVVSVKEGLWQWVVSPGLNVPGITNNTLHNTCQWTIKAPPGHGVRLEVVRLRLPRSRRCSGRALHLLPALASAHTRRRPLARFCGRSPKTRVWTTTFSEIDIKYVKRARGRRPHRERSRSKTRHGDSQDTNHASTPHRQYRPSSPDVDREEKIKRIKELRRLYQLKRRQNEQDHPGTLGRRFYRHLDQASYNLLNQTSHSLPNQTSFNVNQTYKLLNQASHHHLNQTTDTEPGILLDGELLLYDFDTNTYGVVTNHARLQDVRIIGVGEPTLMRFSKNGPVKKKKGLKKDKKLKRQSFSNSLRSPDDSARERNDIGSRWHNQNQHRITSRNRKQYQSQVSRDSHHRSRIPALSHRSLRPASLAEWGRNEIFPRKPAKSHLQDSQYELKRFGYKHPEQSARTSQRSDASAGTRRRRNRREQFVLKVTAFRSECGGEVTEERGRFSNPGYPHKAGGKTSCYWRFTTPAGSHWRLVCEDFQVRRSRECRRDHLAIRVNDGLWARYCGDHGPILALTSSHSASVDVVLSALRNTSARVQCSWQTSSAGNNHLYRDFDKYWSYNITHATTATTTTTTTLPPLAQASSWGCEDYRHLTTDHTMCKPTPSTCAIYRNGVTIEDQALIIAAHNKYRAKVARGEETKGLPGPQYSAADMQQLAWNEELARVAQAWASACPDDHDCHDCRKILSRNYYVGQNIFYEWSSSNGGSVWETAIRLWYEEVEYVPNYLVKDFRSMDHAVIGHYTQLVWATTREIGCGAAYHDCTKVFKGRSWKLKCKIYVCNYGPTGNFLKKPMYTIGPPASSCPDDSHPSTEYSGLCNSH